jgi:hypothetical protein
MGRVVRVVRCVVGLLGALVTINWPTESRARYVGHEDDEQQLLQASLRLSERQDSNLSRSRRASGGPNEQGGAARYGALAPFVVPFSAMSHTMYVDSYEFDLSEFGAQTRGPEDS